MSYSMRFRLQTIDTSLAKLAIGVFLLLGDLSGDHILLWRNLCFSVKEKLYLQGRRESSFFFFFYQKCTFWRGEKAKIGEYLLCLK